MKRIRIFLPAVCCIPLLSGCASYQTPGQAWNVKPFASIRDAADKPDAFYRLGRYYQGQKRYDQAIEAYRKALALDGGFVEALNGLGVIYATQGRHEEATEAFKSAAQAAPDDAHIHNNLGYAYYLQGLYQEAIVALEKATALDPGNKGAYNNLGLAYARAGDAEKSLLAFDQAAKAEPAPEAHADGAIKPPAAVAGEAPAVLSLPKDRGIIARPSAPAQPAESGSRMVEVSPSVYELRATPATVQAAAVRSPAAKQFHIEVSNGNGVTGLARKVAKYLHDDGLPVARITNQKPFRVATTQIQYRNGYRTEALRLSSSMPNRPMTFQSENLRIDTDIRLTLGRDAAKNQPKFVKGDAKADFAAS